MDICPSVCLSVCHTRGLYHSSRTSHQTFFTIWYTMTTCLVNLVMPGNLTAVGEVSGNRLKFWDVSGKKSRPGNVFISNFTFGAVQVFSRIMRTGFVLLNMTLITTTWVREPQRVGKCKGISQCLGMVTPVIVPLFWLSHRKHCWHSYSNGDTVDDMLGLNMGAWVKTQFLIDVSHKEIQEKNIVTLHMVIKPCYRRWLWVVVLTTARLSIYYVVLITVKAVDVWTALSNALRVPTESIFKSCKPQSRWSQQFHRPPLSALSLQVGLHLLQKLPNDMERRAVSLRKPSLLYLTVYRD